jgi:hypothetical protein
MDDDKNNNWESQGYLGWIQTQSGLSCMLKPENDFGLNIEMRLEFGNLAILIGFHWREFS